jgi:aryl-alcohol dehydrogenase-like predicted oxidoreductase
MEYRTFGRTGLKVSVCGLGGGGESRLGLRKGSTEQQAVAVVRRAVDLGITYFDTAPNYGTEAVIGRVDHRSVGPACAGHSTRRWADSAPTSSTCTTCTG